ncbi:MinD/ParA family ATP-binding protein [Gordonia sp. (in: high G+C Gram-positive bacteria)]|uniref:MinD/ParA family ATP-binding protein n=1 Tax=Gordonia sp. (in: high G+C Gram-positive bacteria) TaxID=84139 RepID=UPI0039E4E106
MTEENLTPENPSWVNFADDQAAAGQPEAPARPVPTHQAQAPAVQAPASQAPAGPPQPQMYQQVPAQQASTRNPYIQQGSASPAPFQPKGGLDQIALSKQMKKAPETGWRRAVFSATGGRVNPGESKEQLRLNALIERVRQPIRGDFRLAVLSLKGGVGKTTTTIGLGATYASLRGDRVIAVDANPDLGTLGTRSRKQTDSTVRDLLKDPNVARYADVRSHTSQAGSRLEILASERDPAVSEAFSDEDYRAVVKILRNHYNIILTDCGTGLMHSAMKGVLDLAHGIVLVTSPALDGAQSASATLDWLHHHGYGELAAQSVVVVSSAKPGGVPIDTDAMTQHFLGKTRAVHTIPYDRHLAEGAEIDLELMAKKTRTAFIELAASVADTFPLAHGN